MKWFIPFLALAACASAETTLGPAITTLPIVLSNPGVFHFTKDLNYVGNGTAIDINNSDIVIDFNGHKLVAVSGTTNTANGIVCNNFNRVTIKNGSVLGFLNAIALASEGAKVEGMLVTNNLRIGIDVVGNNATIENNEIDATGGSASASLAIGINVSGTYGSITNNKIDRTYTADVNGHYADGIRLNGCSQIVVSGNHVLDVEPVAPNAATSTGIETINCDNLIILGNIVTNAETGFDLAGASSGSYGDNITSSDGTSYNSGTGITNIGNNN